MYYNLILWWVLAYINPNDEIPKHLLNLTLNRLSWVRKLELLI